MSLKGSEHVCIGECRIAPASAEIAGILCLSAFLNKRLHHPFKAYHDPKGSLTGRQETTMQRILIYLSKPLNIVIIMAFMLLASIGLWYNLTNQYTKYGTGDGKYDDQVDSFSEYIIRNTVLNNIIGKENKEGSLILTRGYPEEDYTYYPEGTKKYYSNNGVHVSAYKTISSKLNREAFIENSHYYFQVFRFINCFLTIICASVFFISFFGRNIISLCAILLFSISGGIALFASNLYFAIWSLFTPLLCFPLIQRGYNKIYVALGFLFSLLYFSLRYEFATTFTLMWLFPLLVLRLKGKPLNLQVGFFVFFAVCIGFLTAVFLHLFSVAQELDVSIREASVYVFGSLQKRVASVENVPMPFSLEFFKWIAKRWTMTGWAFPMLFSVTKLALLVPVFFLLCQGNKSKFFPIFVWSFVAYGSWYIFGYQHIMQHDFFDSLLFAATIQLALILYIMSKIAALLATLSASHEKETEGASNHSR